MNDHNAMRKNGTHQYYLFFCICLSPFVYCWSLNEYMEVINDIKAAVLFASLNNQAHNYEHRKSASQSVKTYFLITLYSHPHSCNFCCDFKKYFIA